MGSGLSAHGTGWAGPQHIAHDRQATEIHQMSASGARLLLIGRDDAAGEALRSELSSGGYDVSVEYDAQAAVPRVRTVQPDLVILDLVLPEEDELEVCRRLHDVSDIPILVLAARATVSDRMAGLDSGADDFMCKPFATDELLARVRALLRRRQASEEDQLRLLSYAIKAWRNRADW